MSEETEVTEEEKFASTEAITFAEKNGLTAAGIEELGIEPSSKEGTFTKKDVKAAIELRDADDDADDDAEEEAEAENTYTYVGGGEDSPRVINFLGRQKFVRGKSTEVTDPVVLSKLGGHPCFVQGTVDEEELYDADEKAREAAEAQRAEDRAINEAFKKKHG